MSIQYQEVLQRFIESRESRNVSQKQLAGLIGVSQGYVSKMEMGRARIPFGALVVLDDNEWDIDRIITGQEYTRTELDDLLEICPKENREELLQLIVWVVRQGVHKYDREVRLIERYAKKMEFLRLRSSDKIAEESVLYGIRTANNLSQQNMAKKLHIDIKKYRALEKNEKYPDAELLMLLYNNFEYMPFGALHGKIDLSEVNKIWSRFQMEEKAILLDFIQKGIEFMNR